MKNHALLRKTLIWMIGLMAFGLCAGLAAGVIILYVRGTAAVQAGEAETVFTREQAAQALRLFVIPGLLFIALLIAAAVLGVPGSDEKKKASVRLPERVCAYRGMNEKRFWLLLLIAAGLIAAGVLNGGLRDVLIKAINICTECIGLG